jgi:hypothetical protein
MAKSNIEKLEAALAKGDLAAAQELTEKLKKAVGAKKPSTPKKPNTPKKPKCEDPPPVVEPAKKPIILLPGSGSLSRRPTLDNPGKVGTTNKGRPARREPLGDRPVEAISPNLTGKDAKLQKVSQKQAEPSKVPRPGQEGARPGASIVEVICEGCNRPFEVYSSEVGVAHDDSGRAYAYYKCNRCIIRGR